MTVPRNSFNRLFNDLDAMKLRIAARELSEGSGYAVYSEDGILLTGFVPDVTTKPKQEFIAVGWKATF